MLDCDGTLVDTLGDFDAALNAMLRQMRRPRIEREQIARFVGRGTEHLLRCVLALQDGGAMPDEATFNQAWAAYLQAYEQVNGTHSRLYPGVREGLAALQAQGLPLACLTNKPQAFARELMRRLGLAPFFRFIHGGDTFARKKPDPLPLLETCRLLGAPPAATLMVGDSRNDAQAGLPRLLAALWLQLRLPSRAGRRRCRAAGFARHRQAPASGLITRAARQPDTSIRRANSKGQKSHLPLYWRDSAL